MAFSVGGTMAGSMLLMTPTMPDMLNKTYPTRAEFVSSECYQKRLPCLLEIHFFSVPYLYKQV